MNDAVNLHSVNIRKTNKLYLWQEKVTAPVRTITKKALLLILVAFVQRCYFSRVIPT